MNEPGRWRELETPEKRALWDRFYLHFGFRPSIRPEDWPGIAEPEPSMTWSIQIALADPDPLMVETHRAFNGALLDALRGFVPLQAPVLALEWQHTCYEFFPHQHHGAVDVNGSGPNPSPWQLPILPDGEYSIFVPHDFSWGTFGHPWEGTLCVWGEPLLARLSPFLDKRLETVVRRNGRPAITAAGSQLVLTIPRVGLVAEKPGADPRSFRFRDITHGLIVSGRFSPASGFRGIEEFWAVESANWKQRTRLPNPGDVAFEQMDSWSLVFYDISSLGMTRANVRAHWVQAGTWIDVHASKASSRSAGLREDLRNLIQSLAVTVKGRW